LAALRNLTGKLRKAQRAKIKRRQANMPKTMKATGRRKAMKSAKEGILNAGKRFAQGWREAGGPTINFGDKKSGAGVARTLNLFGGQAPGVTNMPAMDAPQKVNTPNSSTLSYLSKQINYLADVAANIGAITREQQDNLREQIKDANRIAKEQQMESAGDLVQNAATGSAIDPGRDIISEFYEALAKITEIVEDKVREQQDNTAGGRFLDFFSNRTGLGKFREARKAAAKNPKLRKGVKFDERTGSYRDTKTGKLVKEADALKNLKTVDPSNLKTRTGLVAQAEAVSKPGLIKRSVSGATAKITEVIGKGAQRAKGLTGAAAAGGKIGKDAIIRAARPLVKSALAKTALKSIPIVGAVAGGALAIGRLLQGDVVGAGLEAASGLGGPLTAIPALVASLARDVYISAFNTNPETDPQFGPRMGMVNDAVTGLVKSQLSEKVRPAGEESVQPQQTATGGTPSLSTMAPPSPGGQAQQTSSPSISGSGAPSGGGGGGGGGGSSSGGSGGAAGDASAAATGGGGDAAAAATKVSSGGSLSGEPASTETPTPEPTNATKKLEGEEGSAPPAAGSAPSVKSLIGEKILNASEAESQTAPSMSTTGQAAPKPSRTPTTRPGAKGMGDVPDPGYSDLGSFASQLYFGAAVGAMA
jgi:uncharacterized membrane protein YgcG